MSSTNKTTHYDLSQYTASDKPTYLVDYNADMSAIDTGIYNAQTTANEGAAAIGNIANLTTTDKSSVVNAVNEINGDLGTLNTTVGNHTTAISQNTGNIGTMANLTTNDKTSLVNAIDEVNYNVNNFNLSSFETITSFTLYNRDGNVDTSASATGEITVAKNNDGSLAKLYGRITINAINSTRRVKFQTSLRPSETLNINGGGFRVNISDINGNECIRTMSLTTLTINTNGVCEMEYGYNWSSNERVDFMMINSLMFIKDFGDTPIPV